MPKSLPKIILDRSVESLVRAPEMDPAARVRELPPESAMISSNLRALAALYFTAELDRLKLFAVADVVVEHFTTGKIPLERGPSGDTLLAYLNGAPRRTSEAERREIYARALGLFTNAAPGVVPNTAFLPALTAFAQAVQAFSSAPAAAAEVQSAGRALAENASAHGLGAAHFLAIELQDQVHAIVKMLSAPDVLAAYGVRDVWQLVERVSATYLGGAAGADARALATAGAAILEWLAAHVGLATSGPTAALAAAIQGSSLVNDVARWLAAAGTRPVFHGRFPP